MTSSSNPAHRRTHNLLLISKLFSQREQVSPLTVVLDTLEQTAKPVIAEYFRRARASKCFTIFLAFETIRRPNDTDFFISCWDKKPQDISRLVAEAISKVTLDGHQEIRSLSARASKLPDRSTRVLLAIDSLATLSFLTSTDTSFNLTSWLTSFLLPAQFQKETAFTSLVAVYHTDVPTFAKPGTYLPTPLSLLTYLATTIITVHSLPNILAKRAAEERSLPAPVFGLAEGKEGVLIGVQPSRRLTKQELRGTVIELEHRRKSGRSVHDWFFMPEKLPAPTLESIILLDDHPSFAPPGQPVVTSDDLADMTFRLGLTDRQRQDREGVVLPYFDAQKAAVSGLTGPGEGGRILYDMGAEDDFDDEEDEI